MTVLQMLLPGRAEVGTLDDDPDPTVQALADLYAYPDPMPGRGWVRANMVSSLDGAASGGDGRSGSISGRADKLVFGVLRGLADVLLVGAGTVRAEGYGPVQPRPSFADRRAATGQAPAAALAVVTRSGKVPTDTGLFTPDTGAYVVTTATADLDRLRALAGPDRVIVAGDTDVDLDDAVTALARRGLGRVLCEGGPGLLGAAFAACRVDELCLTWSPVVAGGDAPRITTGAPVDVALRPAHLLAADEVLIGRWLVQRTP